MNELEITNNLEINKNNEMNLEKEQNGFLQTNIGKVVDTGLEIGIRALIPDFIEDDIIEIKDDLFQEGFSEALNNVVDKVINTGKNIYGIITGNIENLTQAKDIIKQGGLVDSVSSLIDKGLDKCEETGLINKNIISIIKGGKKTLLNTVENNVDNSFSEQTRKLEKLDNYMNKWEKYYKKQDFTNMTRQYNKITDILKDILPLENTIKGAREIENLHNLIKNNGKKFNLSDEELELAKKLT